MKNIFSVCLLLSSLICLPAQSADQAVCDFSISASCGKMEFIFTDYTNGGYRMFGMDGNNALVGPRGWSCTMNLTSGHRYIFDIPSIDNGTNCAVSIKINGKEEFVGTDIGASDYTKIQTWKGNVLGPHAFIQKQGFTGGDREVVIDVP